MYPKLRFGEIYVLRIPHSGDIIRISNSDHSSHRVKDEGNSTSNHSNVLRIAERKWFFGGISFFGNVPGISFVTGIGIDPNNR